SFLHSPHSAGSLPPFPTRRSSDLVLVELVVARLAGPLKDALGPLAHELKRVIPIQSTLALPLLNELLGIVAEHLPLREQAFDARSEEHTSELQSPDHLVCRLLPEK